MLKNRNLTTYLAGPMEYTEDNGLGWRLVFKEELEKLQIKSILPNFEELELVKNPQHFNSLKETNTEEYISIMRQLIDIDLTFVLDVDFVIIKWEGERMSGTIGEAQHAYLAGVPVYLVTSQPIKDIPGWFLGCTTEVFENLNCLMLFLIREYGDNHVC